MFAEQIVNNCLRTLRAIPDAARHYSDEFLTCEIARVYLNSSVDDATAQRRALELLRISAEAFE